jgi:hypothetical protein
MGWRGGGWHVELSLHRKKEVVYKICNHLYLYIRKVKRTIHPSSLHYIETTI